MTLKITPAEMSSGDRSLFVSASIPDPERWDGEFDALEITDAIVSLTRIFLTAGWRLVTAAHPTIAPLLLYVAAELDVEGDRRISIYQSESFRRDPADGNSPLPGRRDRRGHLDRGRRRRSPRAGAVGQKP